MAVKVMNKLGHMVTLLSPKEKGQKCAKELREGYHYANDMQTVKHDEDGPLYLGKDQRAYRAGYLDARKDIGKAYESRKKKGK